MDDAPPPARLGAIRQANTALVEQYLSMGDSTDRRFRALCYAASVDKLNGYFLTAQSTISSKQRDQFRTLLTESIRQIEDAYAQSQEDSRQDPIAGTSLGAAGLDKRQTGSVKDEIAVDGAPPPVTPSRTSWFFDMLAFVAGAAAALIIAVALQAWGAIYVHARGESFDHLRRFNDAVQRARPAIEDSLRAVDIVETRLKAALEDGSLVHNTEVRLRFVPATTLFPELTPRIQPALPPSSSLVVRLDRGERSTGYKIVILSDLCSAVAFLYPDRVDPVRATNPVFCRFYGRWNAAGRKL